MPEKLTFDADPNPTLRAYDQLEGADKDFLRQVQKTLKAQSEGNRKTLADMKKVQQQVGRLQRENERLKGGIEKLKMSRSSMFGSGAVSEIGKFAASFVGVQKAIDLTTEALRAMIVARKEAAEPLKAGEQGLSRLIQLAESPEQLKKLEDLAKGFFKAGGAPSLGAAAEQVFALASAGALDQAGLAAQLFGVVGEPGRLVKAARTLQTSRGEGETGSIRDLISKGFAASAFSPAQVEDLLEASARAGTGAKALGVSDEAILGATAITATAAGTAELGGTQVESLLTSFQKLTGDLKDLDLVGLGLVQSLKKVKEVSEARGLSDKQLFEAFGRKEALNAFRVLTSPENIKQLDAAITSIRAAEESDLVGRRIGLAATSELLGPARQARIAGAEQELQRLEQFGPEQLRTEAAIRRFDIGSRRPLAQRELDVRALGVVGGIAPGAAEAAAERGISPTALAAPGLDVLINLTQRMLGSLNKISSNQDQRQIRRVQQ